MNLRVWLEKVVCSCVLDQQVPFSVMVSAEVTPNRLDLRLWLAMTLTLKLLGWVVFVLVGVVTLGPQFG